MVFRFIGSTLLFVIGSVAYGQGAERVEQSEKQFLPVELRFSLSEVTANPDVKAAHANNAVVYREWDGPPLIDGIPEGSKVIDGDIVVPEDFDGQTAATFTTSLWLTGVVPFQFDANVSMANAQAILVAMSWWETVAAVDFVPRDGEGSFIHIQSNGFNNSPVGLTSAFGVGQIINILNWENTGVMAHELGHSLGFYHEQSRPDRDNYVTINTANICQNCCPDADDELGPCDHNFAIRTFAGTYGPYDFDSVMHYGPCFFSADPNCGMACPGPGETITVKPAFNSIWQCGNPPTDNTFIGQTSHLSFWDARVMSFMYAQPNWRFQSSNSGFDPFSGRFFDPFRTFGTAYNETPVGGTLWILDPSTHAVGPVLDKPMIIAAPLGGVTLTR